MQVICDFRVHYFAIARTSNLRCASPMSLKARREITACGSAKSGRATHSLWQAEETKWIDVWARLPGYFKVYGQTQNQFGWQVNVSALYFPGPRNGHMLAPCNRFGLLTFAAPCAPPLPRTLARAT